MMDLINTWGFDADSFEILLDPEGIFEITFKVVLEVELLAEGGGIIDITDFFGGS